MIDIMTIIKYVWKLIKSGWDLLTIMSTAYEPNFGLISLSKQKLWHLEPW